MCCDKSIGMEIKQLNNMIMRCIEREVHKRAHAPTIMHGRIIGYLYQNRERDVFQKDIERDFSIRRSTVTNVLTLMEKKGLIERLEVDYDGRLKRLVLTGKALALHEEFMHGIHQVEARLSQNLTEEEIGQFFEITEKIKKNTL